MSFVLEPLAQPDLSVRAARYRLPFQLPELNLVLVARVQNHHYLHVLLLFPALPFAGSTYLIRSES